MSNELQTLLQQCHKLLVNQTRNSDTFEGPICSHNIVKSTALAFFNEFLSGSSLWLDNICDFREGLPFFVCATFRTRISTVHVCGVKMERESWGLAVGVWGWERVLIDFSKNENLRLAHGKKRCGFGSKEG